MRKEIEIPESPEPPKECFKCGSRKSELYNYDYIDGHILCEYSVRCTDCKQQLAHWAYGHWQY